MASRRARGSCIKTRLQGTSVFVLDKYLPIGMYPQVEGVVKYSPAFEPLWLLGSFSTSPMSVSLTPPRCNHTHMVRFLRRILALRDALASN
jgi:hypothetical protein